MMRDVSARFKYSEREFRAQRKAAAVGASSSSSSDDSENKPPPAAANAAQNSDDDAATQPPDACPSRELIHSHIRRYYRDVDAAAAAATDWEAVSARIRKDLAPYSVLKLGGFSLGDACTRLLGDVLALGASKLRTLDLGFNRLTDKGAAQLAEALETNTSLESLYLSGNEIGPAGARALAQALTKNTHLRSLHLSGNNIGEEGARFLADGITGNIALRALYLGTNGIGAAGMQSLATALTRNKSLEELTLGQNKIGSEGVRHLASAFATGHVALSTLELGKNGVDQEGAIALARSLCGVNRLQNLYMDHNPLGDVGASAFGALLAQNAELRVLDLSYTHMSLLGLRELSVVGLARSRALLCLLVDGHDWASTQYMKKNQHPSLNGASLATKGANNYAASCIVGAINANVHSVLFKLTGVDLSLVVAVPAPSSSGDGRRESDTLTRNELVLKGLHDARAAAQAAATASGIPPSHKRKPTEDAGNAADRSTATGADSGVDSDAGEGLSPVVQHPKFQKLEGNLKAGSSSGSISSVNGGGSGGSRSGSANALLGLLPPPRTGPSNGASSSAGGSGGSSPSKTSSNRPPRVIRIPSRGSMGRFPRSGGSCEKRLSLKSPRYESTMEVHVRKVISDIAKLPFNADEYDTLQAYYLGGRCSTGTSGCGDWGVDNVTGELTPCPACRSSRLAQYRRTMTRLEAAKQATDAELLVLLRQLHYLVGAFQNVENAVQTIDDILVSAHEGMDEPHQFSDVPPLASHKAAGQHTHVLDKTPRVGEETTKYPRAEALGARELHYGTAGFREDATLLVSTCHRMGMLAVLRSKSVGKIVGVMITASHNAANDNGLKIIDPKGDMLSQRWEKYAMQLANAPQDKVVEVLDTIVTAEKIDLDQTGNVFIAKDTRPSSEHLAELAREGALVIGGNVLDFGLQTTPQLHHLVRMWNYEQYNKGDWASEVGYYNMLSDAFKQLTATHDSKVRLLLAKLAKDLGDSLRLEIVNTPSNGELNLQCGAEHVEKSRQPPANMTRENDRGRRYCSMDGDGDRVVFHYFDDESTWHLLDGNKIACLFAEFLADKLHALDLDQEGVTFGCVMTAYANGSATQYLQSKGIRVAQAKTGVKYCHEKAMQFDMAVYFEANGHGTVVFKDALMDKLHKWENTLHDERKKLALSQLLAASQLVNQATGDAMCDLLFVEALLIQKNWNISDWDAIYNDLPSRQTKVKVTDRSVIKSDEEDDTKVLAPENLRSALDAALQEYADKRGRAFVRPSGTEDAVRVYAEADTQQDADALALQLARLVHQLCGGVGVEPTSFVA
ncbi:unnamed protein product [Phytophthora fragariaefolia]|uniref:phosphoacetylglucosamine mutase n=1 Tax=Phytophthora fragariaefolia TaxID=1490495 RepID=A0A9W6Y2V1_9STRA|nr:unnamed protein product [Phytophthora fragariaefolia]